MTQVTKNTGKKALNVATSTKLTKVENINEALKIVDKSTKSKKQVETEQRISILEAKQLKQTLTKQELTWLANAEEKLESKTITRVYRELELKYKAKNDTIVRMVGASKFPTFKEWAAKMPIKSQYSYWDGVCCLVKFNKVATTATKVERQNKKVAAI